MENKDKITVVLDTLTDDSKDVGAILVRFVFDLVRGSISLSNCLHEMYGVDLTDLFATLLFADEIIDVGPSPLKLVFNSFKDIVDIKIIDGDEFKGLLLSGKTLLDLAINKKYFYFLYSSSYQQKEMILSYASKQNSELEVKFLKRSFIIQDILLYIVKKELKSYIQDQVITKSNALHLVLKEFKAFGLKRDFQEGILSIASQFEGYTLTNDIKKWIDKYLAKKSSELLSEIVKIEKIPKFNIYAITQDIISNVISTISSFPLPLSTIAEIYRYINVKRKLKRNDLKFIISLTILKKLLGAIVNMPNPVNCVICSLSIAEIKEMNESDIQNVIREMLEPGRLCFSHMIAYLDLRQKQHLTGRDLLIKLKIYNIFN